eukprot:m.416811 g.416811  ORF g.416811 m.416811 type:complete len:418 (+) comp30110_c0_seq1:124-1377(+)
MAVGFQLDMLICSVFSVMAFVVTLRLIPNFFELFINAGLFGKDLGKANKPQVAEALGTIAAAVYLITMFLFVPVQYSLTEASVEEVAGQVRHQAVRPEGSEFVELTCALLAICCMVFLGFADDVLNLKWRHKLLLPTVASLPLLVYYFASFGSTTVVMPNFVRPYLGHTVDLGVLYYLYMGMLAVFCTNCVNILAGINGVEAGQSLVIAISIVIHNLVQIMSGADDFANHQLSIHLVLPFVGVTAALLYHNWYPSQCFVGDTFCYFGGMTFAVAGILGHFSKMLLLLNIPQVINFVFSVPQLFKFVPCPRHRLPKLNTETGLLEPSTATFKPTDLHPIGLVIVNTCAALRLTSFRKFEDKDGVVQIEVSNYTLINLFLRMFGPTHERTLCTRLLIFQAICSGVAFFIRYKLSQVLYD